jgi:chemotaxis protein histidine kinase CheA
MKRTQQIAAILIFALLGLTFYGMWRTAQRSGSQNTSEKDAPKPASVPMPSLVDQSPLQTAQQLAQLAVFPDEKSFAKEALRLGDFEVDLAFEAALSDARNHPPPLSPEAKEAQERQEKTEKLLAADEDRVKTLGEELEKATGKKADNLEIDLAQAQAAAELDRDELDDAKQDLYRAGGDLVGRIQAAKAQHEETSHRSDSAIPNATPSAEQFGVVHRAQLWHSLHQKQLQLWQAKSQAEASAALLAVQHNALEAKLDEQKESTPELAHHAKKNKTDAAPNPVSAANKSREDASALLKKTQQIAEDQKTLSSLDKRAETQKELASTYAQWIEFVAAEQSVELNRMLRGFLIILAIALVALFFSSWMDKLVNQLTMDRRQIQSLHTLVRVSLQFLALLLILLVVFGPPGQLGTFLGLAGAGLTVALKDFIVGFLGWFVLMGKNGIRLGDWVEINGVTGEVVQIGPFHTVLLETGNWTDSGHPTGRRVTFTNSFAIEGHYFNFSTTGQWLWDELQVALPTGQDPYPMVEMIRKKVIEATKESTQQAEEEWRKATNSREMSDFSAAPAMNVKPVLGGIEVSVRYITRANERYQLRAKLNQAAVELLGGKAAPVASFAPVVREKQS